jgi:hypothetical protein
VEQDEAIALDTIAIFMLVVVLPAPPPKMVG